ncbi:MAG: NUDIX hydrolase [Anaerolineae bacterium]|jgi:ADP-ribose pyrophosphatase YjhB (NUDIX family)
MQIKQVYVAYDRDERLVEGGFRYCPSCGTHLILEERDHKLRPTCPGCGFIHYKSPATVVSVFVVDGNNLLLGKRGAFLGQGRWALPSGYIEYEDDFLTAAVREMKEETNLDVEICAVLNVVSSFLSPRFHFLTVYLLASIVGGELAARDDLEAVDWFPLAGPLPEMAFQEDIDMIEWYSMNRSTGLPADPDFAGQGRGQ